MGSLGSSGAAEFILPSEQVQLIKDSFKAKIQADVPYHAMTLFINLFKIVPEAKGLISMTRDYTGPMRENKALQAHATTVLKKVVNIATNLDKEKQVEMYRTSLATLGGRHIGYGVKLKHAAKLRDAFVLTIANAMGDTWRGDVEAAWIAAYDAIEQMFVVGLVGLAAPK
ncbi:hypothetical protein CLOM_g15453 [Closterium sp. NIES-68]|nr:hypothetical protein CLOM_g9641 [Closterium sp. NIES-68]GJP57738.1 hypothetical protein CLOP_g17304 [Closterium sp. NIES-67]GJP34765.1 hypothetical protein CLOM_g19194 [Closterium sp. NIES-68]GJP36858.1 hypothetical protein CLOM_g21326 [Closterium sp. NIES-68]GJP50167.1 hypothetical protein CLOM_g9312 [Closterium sp. NIES-68]